MAFTEWRGLRARGSRPQAVVVLKGGEGGRVVQAGSGQKMVVVSRWRGWQLTAGHGPVGRSGAQPDTAQRAGAKRQTPRSRGSSRGGAWAGLGRRRAEQGTHNAKSQPARRRRQRQQRAGGASGWTVERRASAEAERKLRQRRGSRGAEEARDNTRNDGAPSSRCWCRSWCWLDWGPLANTKRHQPGCEAAVGSRDGDGGGDALAGL